MANTANGYVACERPGLIEYLVEPGQAVRSGDVLARIYDIVYAVLWGKVGAS